MGFPLQVLWLLGDAPQTERHLRREWANAGLAPAKLFFSGADQQGTRPRDCARCTSAAACGAACAPVSAACWHSQGAWTWRTTCSGYPSQTSSSTRRSTTAARPVRRAAPSSASAVPHTLCLAHSVPNKRCCQAMRLRTAVAAQHIHKCARREVVQYGVSGQHCGLGAALRRSLSRCDSIGRHSALWYTVRPPPAA